MKSPLDSAYDCVYSRTITFILHTIVEDAFISYLNKLD